MANRSREEQREYMREYRRRKSETVADGATVTKLRPRADFSTEQSVRDEIESLPLAEKRPADVAAALAMARILDDPESIPQQASAARQLKLLMDGLRQEGEGGHSKLTALRLNRQAR